jgi:hypothetical protein
MIALEIIGSLFVQLVFTVGFIMLYGGFISLCNRCFYDACGNTAFGIVRLTGYIGTPIHEFSHALMCLLFGHRIKKISLFGDSRRSRTLGYVEHTYYRKNIYHQLGNFFIGISPILAGGAVILLLVRLLTPDVYFSMRAETGNIRAAFSVGMNEGALWAVMRGIGAMFVSLFSLDSFMDWRWWICMVLVFSIAIHMEISRSDIVSGFRGLGVIAALLVVADIILGLLFPATLSAVTAACVTAGVFIALLMLIPAMFSFIIGAVSLLTIFFRESAQSIRNDQAEMDVNYRKAPARRRKK